MAQPSLTVLCQRLSFQNVYEVPYSAAQNAANASTSDQKTFRYGAPSFDF